MKKHGVFAAICTMVLAISTAMTPNVAKAAEGIRVDNVQVNDVSESGYTVTCDIVSDNAIDKVTFPTWTEANGQDDIVWLDGTVTDKKATFKVESSAHNNELGKYITHIYAYDTAGNVSEPMGAYASLEKATIEPGLVPVKNIFDNYGKNQDYYEVFVETNQPVKTVGIATWTEANDQDDLKWQFQDVNYSEGNIVGFKVDYADHNKESGTYINHIYAYDESGNVLVLSGYPIDVTYKVTAKTEVIKDENKYQIKPVVPAGTSKIAIATWTEANGQDDLIWQIQDVNLNANVFTINMSDHANQTGTYINHIYSYDKNGAILGLEGCNVYMAYEYLEPAIIPVSADGYMVQFAPESNAVRVAVATWTEANGQDDLKWQSVDLVDSVEDIYNSPDRVLVSLEDHNFESGVYINHIYTYDNAGNIISIRGITTNVGYDAIYNIWNNDPICIALMKNVAKVSIATWTEANGQDDLKWTDYNTSTDGEVIEYRIVPAEHNNETGKYITHVYAYDKDGNVLGLKGWETTK